MRSRYDDWQTGGWANLHRFRGGYCIGLLFVPHENRGEGGASRLIKRICSDADASGKPLFLLVGPDPDSSLDYWDLVAFYGRYGFKPQQGSCYYKRERSLWAQSHALNVLSLAPEYMQRCSD